MLALTHIRPCVLLLFFAHCLLHLNACSTAGPSQSAQLSKNTASESDYQPIAKSAYDVDGDGIPDAIDLCDNTPGPQPVDFEGCPIFAGALQDVDFPADEADLNNRARRSLDKLVLRLQRYPEVVLAIDAHTDNRGSGQVNLELSKRRVMAVVRYLVARGVPPHQLRPYGYGESRPIISNATPEGRRQNRRIEVSVVLQPEAGEQPQPRVSHTIYSNQIGFPAMQQAKYPLMTLWSNMCRAGILALLGLLITGCGTMQSAQQERAAPAAMRAQLDGSIRYDTTDQQVAELWSAAEEARRNDEDDAALDFLYQALDISPENGLLWSRAAEVQLDNNQALMAENLALKSNAFAADNSALLHRNWLIIEHARSLRGDLLGVRDARKRVQQYQYQ